jgi:hypothetical protein
LGESAAEDIAGSAEEAVVDEAVVDDAVVDEAVVDEAVVDEVERRGRQTRPRRALVAPKS